MPGVGLLHGLFWGSKPEVDPPIVSPFDLPPRAAINFIFEPRRRKEDLIPWEIRVATRAQQLTQELTGDFIAEAVEKHEAEIDDRRFADAQRLSNLSAANRRRMEIMQEKRKERPALESRFAKEVQRKREQREQAEDDMDSLEMRIKMAELRARREALRRAPEEIQ